LVAFAANVHREIGRTNRREDYDCHRNRQKAEAIGDRLIQDWTFAKKLVEWHGGKFIGVLQPVVYTSRTPTSRIGDNEMALVEHLRPEFEVLYPLLRANVARFEGDARDFSSVLDGEEPVYTDFCHLTPRGNAIVAERIGEIVSDLIGQR
jgi:hypothetical protein